MEGLLKKLDEKMTSDLVRKLGGLFCFVMLILSVVAFLIGSGSLLKTLETAEEAVVESEAEEAEETDAGSEAEDAEEEAAEDEELTEDAAEGETSEIEEETEPAAEEETEG